MLNTPDLGTPVAANCHRCPALVANRRQVVQGYGAISATVYVVGEAPGRHGADRTGVPFTGDRSGRRLQQILINLGLSRESNRGVEAPVLKDCYLTNVVRCNPPGNRSPTRQEIANCRSYLAIELEKVRPRIIVAAGRKALDEICRLHHLESPPDISSAQAIPIFSAGRVILPIRHPSRASNFELHQAEIALRFLLSAT